MTEPGIRRVFVDTSAFFGAVDRSDASFEAAQRILARLARERRGLTTTTYVVAETHPLFMRRLGRNAGEDFLRSLDTSDTVVVRPSDADEATAREIIYRYTDKSFSLTDAISSAVMARLEIPTAFTFDRDFEQYGLSVERP